MVISHIQSLYHTSNEYSNTVDECVYQSNKLSRLIEMFVQNEVTPFHSSILLKYIGDIKHMHTEKRTAFQSLLHLIE